MSANGQESSVSGWSTDVIASIAAKVGTPFMLYRAETILGKIAEIKKMTADAHLQARCYQERKYSQ